MRSGRRMPGELSRTLQYPNFALNGCSTGLKRHIPGLAMRRSGFWCAVKIS